MKICSKCRQEKDLDEFYKDKAAKDGYNCICKLCRLEMDRDRRKRDPAWVERRRLQNRQFHKKNREDISKRKKAWRKSDDGKRIHRECSRRWKKKNRTKVLAHGAVERAVKRGELIPKKHCEVCNSKYRIEAHHPDHRKRLVVIWLCKYCHAKLT